MRAVDLLPVNWDLSNRNTLRTAEKQNLNVEGPSFEVLSRENKLGGVSREDLEAALCIFDVVLEHELN